MPRQIQGSRTHREYSLEYRPVKYVFALFLKNIMLQEHENIYLIVSIPSQKCKNIFYSLLDHRCFAACNNISSRFTWSLYRTKVDIRWPQDGSTDQYGKDKKFFVRAEMEVTVKPWLWYDMIFRTTKTLHNEG